MHRRLRLQVGLQMTNINCSCLRVDMRHIDPIRDTIGTVSGHRSNFCWLSSIKGYILWTDVILAQVHLEIADLVTLKCDEPACVIGIMSCTLSCQLLQPLIDSRNPRDFLAFVDFLRRWILRWQYWWLIWEILCRSTRIISSIFKCRNIFVF